MEVTIRSSALSYDPSCSLIVSSIGQSCEWTQWGTNGCLWVLASADFVMYIGMISLRSRHLRWFFGTIGRSRRVFWTGKSRDVEHVGSVWLGFIWFCLAERRGQAIPVKLSLGEKHLLWQIIHGFPGHPALMKWLCHRRETELALVGITRLVQSEAQLRARQVLVWGRKWMYCANGHLKKQTHREIRHPPFCQWKRLSLSRDWINNSDRRQVIARVRTSSLTTS